LIGGISGRGSMVAWVNLNRLPSASGTYFYIAGESQNSNDFDIQFQNDDRLYFYTGAGENTSYQPDPGTLVGHWNQIAVTYDSAAGFRNIYWNGVLVASALGGINPAAKTSSFTIGYTPVFPGRDFDGLIDEVAVFDYALNAGQVSQLYATAVPEPSTSAMVGAGMFVICLAGRRRSAPRPGSRHEIRALEVGERDLVAAVPERVADFA
jgi:Concanavalin A-like lectin/glucanases superfamily/PEP-CTERM motif